MSQKRHQKQLKRRKNKNQSNARHIMRLTKEQHSALAYEILAEEVLKNQALKEDKE